MRSCFLWTCAIFLLACETWSTRALSNEAKELRIAEMVEEIRRDLPEVPSWTPHEVAARRDQVVLVDVRPEPERRVSRIPGAISLQEWESLAGEATGPEEGVSRTFADRRYVVAYCTIGRRSSEWVRRQREAGVAALGFEAVNLSGSLLAWSHAGFDLEDEAGRPTRRLHVYGPAWDLAPEGWHTVW